MPEYKDQDGTTFVARERISGVFVDPELPDKFGDTPNEARPPSHTKWWDRPYIETFTWEKMAWPTATEQDRATWFQSWPSGTRYDVCCLDGGAWDRPTSWGSFATLEEAIACASGPGPSWRRRV